jgi:hypothetical protein
VRSTLRTPYSGGSPSAPRKAVGASVQVPWMRLGDVHSTLEQRSRPLRPHRPGRQRGSWSPQGTRRGYGTGVMTCEMTLSDGPDRAG